MSDNDQSPELKLTRLADVEPERVEWLWPGRIPKGKITTLDGDPGLGKSTLALNIGATITTGSAWPDGGRCQYPGDVLLLSAEDGLADTVRPRLDAAGADVTRVHAIEGKSCVDPDNGDRYLRPLSLADVYDLDTAMAQTGARLLIVDVLMAFLPAGADAHKDQDIRRVLSALGAAGERNGCTVLLLRHLNKAKGGDPLYRGGGSIGIVGAARSGLLVAADPDDPTRRVLACVKSNLGVKPDSLVYRLVNTPEHGVARVVWDGTTTHDAHGLLSSSHDDDAADRNEIDTWMTDLLQAGSVKSNEVFSAADAAGFSKDQAKRAKKRLGIRAERPVNPGPWFWSLPADNPEAQSEAGSTPTHMLPALPALPVRSEGVEQGAERPREQSASDRSLPFPDSGNRQPECIACDVVLTTPRSIAAGLCAECQLIANNTDAEQQSAEETAMPAPRPTTCKRCYVQLPTTATTPICDECDGAPAPKPITEPTPAPPLRVVENPAVAKREYAAGVAARLAHRPQPTGNLNV